MRKKLLLIEDSKSCTSSTLRIKFYLYANLYIEAINQQHLPLHLLQIVPAGFVRQHLVYPFFPFLQTIMVFSDFLVLSSAFWLFQLSHFFNLAPQVLLLFFVLLSELCFVLILFGFDYQHLELLLQSALFGLLVGLRGISLGVQLLLLEECFLLQLQLLALVQFEEANFESLRLSAAVVDGFAHPWDIAHRPNICFVHLLNLLL